MGDAACVSREAIGAAWESVRFLDHRTSPRDRREAERVLREVIRRQGQAEVGRALIFLVAAVACSLGRSVGESDLVGVLIPAVLQRLRRGFGNLPEGLFPMLGAVMTAAAQGLDAVAWRDQYGRLPNEEALALAYLLWLLSDFNDSMLRPGATEEIMRTIVKAAPLQPAAR